MRLLRMFQTSSRPPYPSGSGQNVREIAGGVAPARRNEGKSPRQDDSDGAHKGRGRGKSRLSGKIAGLVTVGGRMVTVALAYSRLAHSFCLVSSSQRVMRKWQFRLLCCGPVSISGRHLVNRARATRHGVAAIIGRVIGGCCWGEVSWSALFSPASWTLELPVVGRGG